MSTALSISLAAAKVSSFLKFFKINSQLFVICHDGIVFLSIGNATLAVGETEHDDVQFAVDAYKVGRFIGVAKSRPVSFEVITDGKSRQLQVDGPMGTAKFVASKFHKSENPFASIGDSLCTIELSDVQLANTIRNRCDTDTSRYALATVQFEDGFAVATDGRRLVTLTCGQYDEPVMVDHQVIEFAAKHAHDVEVLKIDAKGITGKLFLVGELIYRSEQMRFPNWKQVCELGDGTETIRVNCEGWRKSIESHLAMFKAGQVEDHGFDFQITESNHAKLDVRFVKDALGKLGSVQARFLPKFNKQGKLAAPIELTSDERIGWREIIMPMARD